MLKFLFLNMMNYCFIFWNMIIFKEEVNIELNYKEFIKIYGKLVFEKEKVFWL